MTRPFHASGLSGHYPENWLLTREDSDEGWTITLESPDTAFMSITLRKDAPDPQALATEALVALRGDYASFEAEPCLDSLAGQPAYGHDYRFICLDLTNSGWTRCFAIDSGTVLVIVQATDHEWPVYGDVFRAICASMRTNDE